MKYALFDAGGLPLAFYAPEISGTKLLGGKPNPRIPAETVEISDGQWREFIENTGARRWDGTGVQKLQPVQTSTVPPVVDDWQFAGQAAAEGIITRAEALEWSGAGVVPPSLVKAVDRLITDEDQHFKVMIFLRGAKSYPRAHSLVPLLGRVFGKNDDAALDAFWIAAGQR